MNGLIYSFFKFIKINIYYRFRYNLIYLFKKQKSILDKNDLDFNDLKELKVNGFVKINNFFDRDKIYLIKNEFEKNFQENFDNFFYSIHPSKKQLVDKISLINISQNTNYISLKDPLIFIPNISELLNTRLYNFIQSYFKCEIGLTSINIRKSFLNKLSDVETNIYHKDENSYNLLKVFIYLNDVDENTGPFIFVKKTHNKSNLKFFRNYRIDDEVINDNFDSSEIISLTGKVGDIIVANTRGLHKGKKVINKERNMLTLTFGIHNEYFNKKSKVNINKSILFNQSNYDKRFFKLANIID